MFVAKKVLLLLAISLTDDENDPGFIGSAVWLPTHQQVRYINPQ